MVQTKKTVKPKPRKTRKPVNTAKRKSRAKKKPSILGRVWQSIKNPVLKLSALLIFVFICYLGYLDYTVRKQFEGKRWAIPARVYASPLEVYAGARINASQLLLLLKKLHYRSDSKLSSQATYIKTAQTIHLKTRKFAFWDKTQDVQYIRIKFSANEVLSIQDVESGRRSEEHTSELQSR